MKKRLSFGFAPVASFLIFFVLVAGLFAGIWVLRNGVTLSSHASVATEKPVTASLADFKAGLVHNSKVLYITLNPSDSGKDIATEYYSWTWEGKSLAQVEELTPTINIDYYKKLSEGRVNFQVVKTINLTTSPKYTNNYVFTVADYDHCVHGGLLSNGLSCEDQKHLFDHETFLNENNVCSIVNENGIDEIWLLSNPFITTWEAWMIGPNYGFGPNGGVYVDKKCNKHVVVMSAVYNKIEPMGHIFGHRIEATMSYMDTYWKKGDRIKYVENFMNLKRYATTPYGVPGPVYKGPGCGNAHVPLTGLSHYDYSQPTFRDFDCVDWNNLPDFKGKTKNFNCDIWGCSDVGWNAYWQASLPHRAGDVEVSLTDGRKVSLKRDWWTYVLNPDAAIKFVNKSMPKGAVSEAAAEPFKLPAHSHQK